jgi:hypothetical protein
MSKNIGVRMVRTIGVAVVSLLLIVGGAFAANSLVSPGAPQDDAPVSLEAGLNDTHETSDDQGQDANAAPAALDVQGQDSNESLDATDDDDGLNDADDEDDATEAAADDDDDHDNDDDHGGLSDADDSLDSTDDDDDDDDDD